MRYLVVQELEAHLRPTCEYLVHALAAGRLGAAGRVDAPEAGRVVRVGRSGSAEAEVLRRAVRVELVALRLLRRRPRWHTVRLYGMQARHGSEPSGKSSVAKWS